MAEDETRKQVAAQCKAVAHLATALAHVHTDKAQVLDGGGYPDGALERLGAGTAAYMEILGDILNGMDAVDEKEDAWLDPIFEEAQRRWPTK